MNNRLLHFVWVGDKPEPSSIETWKNAGADYCRVWNEFDLKNDEWVLKDQIGKFLSSVQYHGAADLMRYEILYKHGGHNP